MTDLVDWQRESLDSLAERVGVKSRFVPAVAEAVKREAGGDGLPALKLALGLIPPGEAPPLVARATRLVGGWQHLIVVDQAPRSQYDVLVEAARHPQGLPGPVVALALAGHGFHGNRGRPWLAARGNLHLSCALPVDLDLRACAAAVPALPAVAVIDAMARCAPGLSPRLKWVNDILIGEAKTGGVLAAAQTRGTRLLALTFGIGVNVALAPPIVPTLSVPHVTCLHDHVPAATVDLGTLVAAVLEALWMRIEQLQRHGAARVTAAYREAWGDLGRLVAVWPEGLPDTADAAALPPPLARGRALALTDDLALVVEDAPKPLHGGRLARLDAPPPVAAQEPTR